MIYTDYKHRTDNTQNKEKTKLNSSGRYERNKDLIIRKKIDYLYNNMDVYFRHGPCIINTLIINNRLSPVFHTRFYVKEKI